MKRVIEVGLMLCGVLFLIELAILGWFYVADPLEMFGSGAAAGIKATVTPGTASDTSTNTTTEAGSGSGSPSQAQVEAAAAVGVEIPAFTETQLQCFVGIFGEARVTEIKNGAVPTALEMYKGKSCL